MIDFLLPSGVLTPNCSGPITQLCPICSGKDVYVIHIEDKNGSILLNSKLNYQIKLNFILVFFYLNY